MITKLLQLFFRVQLARAGIALNGTKPGDMVVHDSRVFRRILSKGSLGLGESYMDGWWDCIDGRVDIFIYKVLVAELDHSFLVSPILFLRNIVSYVQNWSHDRASKERASDIGDAHYNIGNDLFRIMLDKRMVYTCAYFRHQTDSLDAAQEAKLELVCRKIGLVDCRHLSFDQKPVILDIGCGWGSFAKYAAEKYGVRVIGITVAQEQIELGQQLCEELPVKFRLMDYRDVSEQFDHIVSLGMFEHVEPRHYDEYFAMVKRCLKPGGKFLLHTIGKYTSGWTMDEWIGKYIFPVGQIPAREQVWESAKKYLAQLDWHEFGSRHYEQTLMEWYANFHKQWEELSVRYGGLMNGQFKRMWEYYLLSCAGVFRAEELDVFHGLYALEYEPVVVQR